MTDFTIVNVALPTIARKLHFPFLIVMRGIQGFGAALVLPAALSIVMNLFSEGAERNKALGIWGGVGALGGTVGLLAGGVPTTYVGWQYIFWFNIPVGAVALALAPKLVPESRAGRARRRYDPFGAASITAALLLFVYAISQAPQVGWAGPQTVAMLAAGAALLAMFFVIETKVEAPLLPLPLLRLRSVAGSNAVGFLLGTSFMTFVFLGTLYMQQVLGLSALATGAAWMTASVTSLACAGLSQRIVTKTSPKAVMAVGMALIGTACAFIPISIGALTGVTERDAGVASGLLNTSQNLGGTIGVAIASSIAASHSRTLVQHGYGTAAALTGGFHWALWVCGLTGLAAVPVAFLGIRRAERPGP